MHIMTFREILIEITGGQAPLCTIREIADQMRKEPETVYGYRNGNQPKWRDVVALAEYLIEEYEYYKLAMQTLLTSKGTATNIDAVLLDVMEATVQMRRGAKRGDDTDYQNGLGKMTLAFETLKGKGGAHGRIHRDVA